MVESIKVIKRDGRKVDFEKNKITDAILKAMKNGSGIVEESLAKNIATKIKNDIRNQIISIYEIENMVFDELISNNHRLTAKAYEGYRKIREFQREKSLIDNAVIGIVNGSNKDALNENSNKDAFVASTQRDLIAGEVSKDICRRTKLPTYLVQAHDEGIMHFHDMDYFIQPIFNCDLVNLKDMLTNGTVINKKMIEPPKSLQTACTVATQIVQQIANGQYGGQTISLAHLAPWVRVSKKKLLRKYKRRGYSKDLAEQYAMEDLREEISAGVQTIQYQVNTFSTSNGLL